MVDISGTKKKIAIICGYSDKRLREKLVLKRDRPLFRLLIKIFHLPNRVGIYSDHAPWISIMIDEFQKREDVEIHIISPHISMEHDIQDFEENGVFYHIYCSEFSSFARIVKNLRLWKLLQRNSSIVCGIIDRIKPDLINIVGIENPETAIPALYIKGYPVFALCQTIYSNPERYKYAVPKKLNWELEETVIRKLRYFGVYSNMHYELLKQKNHQAIVFDYQFPKAEMPAVTPLPKKYDFVNFALQQDERKGLFDSLKALAIVKEKHPLVKLNLIGRFNENNRVKADRLMEELRIRDNVIITPFFEKQEDMFQHLQHSRFALLPCKLDVTSGTMTQAMYYGLPMVVYKTTGTPKFNLEKECALIAEMNDIEDLSSKMLLLLQNPDRAEQLRENARGLVANNKPNSEVIDRLVKDYFSIIDNFNSGKEIPDYLLFKVGSIN